MSDTIALGLVLAHAEAWLGTPYVPRGALRGAGADCVGLLRGLYAELCGRAVPAPAWAPGAALAQDQPMARALARHMVPRDLDGALPGHVKTLRIGSARAAHVALDAGGGAFFHAGEDLGVVRVPGLDRGRPATSAWAFPCPPGCVSGPAGLTAADCLAVVHPHPAGAYGEILDGADGAALARTAPLPSVAAVLDLLEPIYHHIETVR